MAIGTATNHNTDFTNILGERSNASYYYTTEQIIDEEITNIEASDAAIDSELPNAEAKTLAFSRLCAAVENPIWLDVQRHNQLVDEIIGFHSTRLATAEMLAAYTATIPQSTRDGANITNSISIGFTSLYDPNTSVNGRDYLNTPANGTANILAWPSNIGIGSTSIGVSTAPSKADSGVDSYPQSRYQYQIKRACGISLNTDQHWNGSYRSGYTFDPTGKIYIDEDGELVIGDEPELECPLEHQLTDDGETEIFKVNIRIRGYDLEGENPVEIVECDLSGETAGVGTISIYQTKKHRFDAGINTTTSGSWTWEGVSYSGDVTEGSANYTNYVQPRLDEIAELKTKIQDALPNLNKIKDARTDSDLYYWSLNHSKVIEGERKDSKEGNIQAIQDSQELFDESAGVPPPQEPEVNPVFNKPFEDLNESEKQQLSLTYGLGTPREIPSRDEDGDVIRDENGEIVMTTDDGYNIDYIDSKIQEFLELNKDLDVTGDFVVTMPGSIIIVNSVGSATTYTGVSTQINNITTGGINTSNVVGNVGIVTFDTTPPGINTSHIFKSPAHLIGAGVTYAGSIGVATAQWDEIYVRTLYAKNIVGSATSTIVSAASTSDTLPIIFGSEEVTDRSSVSLLSDSDLTYQESTRKLTSFAIKATEIYDSGDATGNTQEVPVADGNGGWQWSAVTAAGVAGAAGTISQIQYHNNSGVLAGSDEFTFIQSTGRVGIGSTIPTTKLDISGNLTLNRGSSQSGLTRTLIINGARNLAETSDYARIQFKNFDSNSGAVDYVGAEISARLPLGDVVDGGELVFSTSPDTNAPLERVRIDQDGNVGIGTTNHDVPVGVGNTAKLSVGIVSAYQFYGDGSNLTNISASQVSALSDVIDDITPQLGGDLDLNSNDITGTGQINITGVITATEFHGDGSNLTSVNAATATTSTNVTVADESADTTCFPLFVTAATGDLPPKSGTNLTFNSSDGTLSATEFSGGGSGLTSLNASNISSGTIDNARLPGTITSNLNGNAATATTSTNVTVADESTDTTCFPLFVTAATGNLPPKSGTNLTFDSSTGELTATSFSGSVAYSNVTGVTTEISADTSPQLGGDLDLNSNNITGIGSVSITGVITATSFSGDGSNLTNITASPGGSDGQIQYNNGGSVGGAAQLYYDDTNDRLGIGTDVPGESFIHLHSQSTGEFNGILLTNSTTGIATTGGFTIGLDASERGRIWHYGNESITFGVDNELHGTLRQDGRWCLGPDQDSGSKVLNVFNDNGPSAEFSANSNPGIEIKDDSDNSVVEIMQNNGQLSIDLDHTGQVDSGESFTVKKNADTDLFTIGDDGEVTITGRTLFQGTSLSIFSAGGLVFNDNRYAYFGTGAGNDYRLGTDGSNLFLDMGNSVGNFIIRDGSTSRYTFTQGGQIEVGTAFGEGNNGYKLVNGGSPHVIQRTIGNAGAVINFYGTNGRARVMGDGDLQNTNNNYGSISDIKLKENIVDASSQWEDIKAIRFRKYNYKEETGFSTHTQLGVIAQELESISPGLVRESRDVDVDSDEEYTGTVTKTVNYSVLYLKAVVALQEAMERIEQLEARLNNQ